VGDYVGGARMGHVGTAERAGKKAQVGDRVEGRGSSNTTTFEGH